ncbi:MAG: TIGR01212 family radical SAM protein [Bacilli bacterium]
MYSSDNKRYHTLSYYFKSKFGKKVFKVNLNADFTCPNRDGTKGSGGCIFCSSEGSGETAGNPRDNLVKQFNQIKNQRLKKWPDSYYVGYFQAFSNTYGSLDKLKTYYEIILKQDNVVGLHIATRPDCISDEMITYFQELSLRCDFWIELGLQSTNDETARFLNRGHTFNEYISCVKKLRKAKIKVCTHIINGIFNETEDDMLNTIKDIVNVGVDGVKIHMMHIIKGTALEYLYNENNFNVLSREEFVDITCKQLELIPSKVVIFRIGGDVPQEMLVAPQWVNKKFITLNEIDKYQKNNFTFQGKLVCEGKE